MKLATNFGHEFDVRIKKGQYGNRRIALEAIDQQDGSPVAKLTVNMVDLDCPKDHAWIKDYSENEGFMKQLIAEKVISEPKSKQRSGWVTVFLCEVLV